MGVSAMAPLGLAQEFSDKMKKIYTIFIIRGMVPIGSG